jgi:hypothetical protein
MPDTDGIEAHERTASDVVYAELPMRPDGAVPYARSEAAHGGHDQWAGTTGLARWRGET